MKPVVPISLILAAIALEALFYRWQGRAYPWKDAGASLAVHAGDRLIAAGLTGVALPFFQLAWRHRLFTIPIDGPLALLALFLTVEFLYYWQHRASHEVRWFWASHSVHHSTPTMTFSGAYRIGWTGRLTGLFVFLIPAALIGFPPRAIFAAIAFNLFYQFWLHTELVPKLGWFEEFLNTPSHHRAHHASNARYLDKNYGGVLIVYDRLFGTFVREDEPCRYGLVDGTVSRNPLRIWFHEWCALARDLRGARGGRDALAIVFGRPGRRRSPSPSAPTPMIGRALPGARPSLMPEVP